MAVTGSDTMRKENSTDLIQEPPVYCICRSSEIDVFMIRCDFCEEWYHGHCIKITEKGSEAIDKFCCKACKTKNPGLRTTFKKKNRRKIIRVKNKSEETMSKYYKGTSNSTSIQNSKILNVKAPKITTNAAQANKCLNFVDTTVRKAKTEAYKKFKQSRIPEQGKTDKMETKTTVLKQCYGPNCTRPSRNGSKYCSDACGITLAKHRILEILPGRIQQWNNTPPVADQLNGKKLTEIRAKQHDIEKQFEELDKKIIKLIEEITNSKNPTNHFVELHCDETTPMDCVICGSEVPSKFIEKHLEQCFLKLEKKVMTDDKIRPTDEKWNIFCNRKIGKNSWCKKMKVLCSLHYQNYRKMDEVCGYYLGEENGVSRYCGNKGRTCNHLNWEEIHRATLDLEKLNLLLKFTDLKNEEEKIRREMSRRGDVLSLMCNFTIEH